MKLFLPLLGFFLAPVCLVPATRAAVDPGIIPADARWVVYADLNALRASPIGAQLVAFAEKAQADAGKGPVGIDVQKVMATVGTATAYGTNFSKDPKALDGTLVLQGTPDLRKIAESIILQAQIAHPESFSEVTDLPFAAYAIHPNAKAEKDGKDETAKSELIVAFPPEGIILISKARPQLLKARELYRTHQGSIAKSSDAPLTKLLQSSGKAFIFATTVVPSENMFPEDGPQARILQMTHSGAIGIGEEGGKTFAHAQLVATSDAMADKMMKILQGMTAMMSLAETNDQQLAEFLNSATVTREDEVVQLNLSYSSERLAQMLRSTLDEHKPHAPASPEDAAVARNRELYNGTAVDQWQAEAKPADQPEATPAPLVWRTIEKVALKNGTLISLGRQMRGGTPARFDRVEIIPSEGGTPLTFQTQFMTRGGAHNNFLIFQFPGADGTYTLKIAYVNDRAGKTTYTVSVRQPKTPDAEPAAK